jgi:glucose/arabinose dehydrogenase
MSVRTCLVSFSLIALACGDDGAADAESSSGTTAAEPTTSSSSTETTSSSGVADSTSSSSGGGSTTTTGPDPDTSGSSSESSTTGGLDEPGTPNCDPPEGELPTMMLEPFITDIAMPITMVSDPTVPNRFYVGERTGQIHVVEDGVVLPTLWLDLSANTYCCDNDAGFIGFALHPDFADNGLFYVHHTPTDISTVLDEYQRSADDPDVADPTPVRQLFAHDQFDVWHYGGTIEFGPDGMLYYSRGDGGGVGDPEGDAQDPLSQLGKILRIDVESFPEAPDGNMPDADPFVWDMGLRNPWRTAFDPCTGDLYIGDVGQGTFEEVSIHPADGTHFDFGWNIFEGNDCYNGPCDDPTPFTMPVAGFYHDDGGCAVIGGHVYRGDAMPGMRGRYLYGDICTRRIWSFRYEDGVAMDLVDHTLDLDSALVLGDYTFGSFAQDADGEMYVLDMSGVVYRLVER